MKLLYIFFLFLLFPVFLLSKVKVKEQLSNKKAKQFETASGFPKYEEGYTLSSCPKGMV